MDKRIIVVGIGPGNPAYILPIALGHIKKAKILVGSRWALETYAAPSTKTMPVGGDIPAVIDFIRAAKDDVVVMVSGDPGYYSLLSAIRREFDTEMITVIPGISSMQLAFARLSMPWQDAELLSFHGRIPPDSALVYEPQRLIGMLTDNDYDSKAIAQRLILGGWPEDCQAYICSRLSYEDEAVISLTLNEAAVAPAGYGSCIMVVKA